MAEIVRTEAPGAPSEGLNLDGGVADGGGSTAPDGGVAEGGPPEIPPLPEPLATARAAMAQLARNLEHVQRLRARGPQDSYTADCLAQKEAEARVGLQIGDEEMARLHDGIDRRDRSAEAYAVHRLQLLVDRAKTVLDGARICAAQDPGGITATKVEVEVSPAIPLDDPTAPPSSFQPVGRPPKD